MLAVEPKGQGVQGPEPAVDLKVPGAPGTQARKRTDVDGRTAEEDLQSWQVDCPAESAVEPACTQYERRHLAPDD